METTPKKTPALLPRAVCVAEAAAAMGIGTTTAWRMIGEGLIDTVKLGGRTLVEVAEIDRVIERNRRSRTAA